MKGYFWLQYKMTNRWFADAGIRPVFGYLLSILAFVGLSVYLFSKTESAVYVYLLAALALVAKLSETQRVAFLRLSFGDRKTKTLRLLENYGLALPFFVFLACKTLFFPALLLIAIASALSLVDFRTSWGRAMWTPFSQRPFEFVVGFRSTFYLIAVTYALTLIAICIGNFNLGAFAMLMTFALLMGYYTKPENEYYVWAHATDSRGFLLGKLKTGILQAGLIVLPIAGALALSFRQDLGATLLCLLLGWAFLAYMIVNKYVLFPQPPGPIQAILLAFCITFPPLLIVMAPYLFQQSQKRLSSLLK